MAWGTFGRTDLQKISSGYPERGLEGKVRAPGRNIHLRLQIPHPTGLGHSMRRARWDLQSSGLIMPFCLVQGWFYRIAIIGLNQETILVLVKFTLNSWVW